MSHLTVTVLAFALALTGCTVSDTPSPSGSPGSIGGLGATGPRGPAGAQGSAGATGPAGSNGTAGTQGATGPAGSNGTAGTQGATGPAGSTGLTGIQGAAGSGEAALFFALIPTDDPVPVYSGADVAFPQDGPSTTTAITRVDDTTFDLAVPGTYRVTVQMTVNEPGQLILVLNGADLPYTVVGRDGGSTQIIMTTLVQTTTPNERLEVQNSGFSSLTINRSAGGTRPVSATLLIELVKK